MWMAIVNTMCVQHFTNSMRFTFMIRSSTITITMRQIHTTVPVWMVPEDTEFANAYYAIIHQTEEKNTFVSVMLL